MAQELTNRLMALGRAQELARPTPGRKNEGALLGDLISILLAPYDEKEASVRIRVSVPKMKVGEASSTTLAHRTMAAQLGGTIASDWSEEGLVVTLRMGKDRLAH